MKYKMIYFIILLLSFICLYLYLYDYLDFSKIAVVIILWGILYFIKKIFELLQDHFHDE